MAKRKDGVQDRLEHFAKLGRMAEEAVRTGKPVPPMEDRVVKPFADPIQNVIEFTTITREYHHPFHYKNITHHCFCNDPSNAGIEINPCNSIDGRTDPYKPEPGDYIALVEERPIVRLVIIGSACTPPGWVAIEAEECEGFRRPDEMVELMPVRMRIENLWGTHVRGDCWIKDGTDTGIPLPEHFTNNWPYNYQTDFPKTHRYTQVTANNYPLAGMSCAIFELPASKKVRIMGGSLTYGWTNDGASSGDNHYSFRMIRADVLGKYEAVEE